MNEVLTRAEMEAQFEGEWVLVADPELDQNREVVRGQVAYHGKDREAMYDCHESLHLRHAAYLYFGPMPKMRVCINLDLLWNWGLGGDPRILRNTKICRMTG